MVYDLEFGVEDLRLRHRAEKLVRRFEKLLDALDDFRLALPFTPAFLARHDERDTFQRPVGRLPSLQD